MRAKWSSLAPEVKPEVTGNPNASGPRSRRPPKARKVLMGTTGLAVLACGVFMALSLTRGQ